MTVETDRRKFITYFATIGLSSTLLPGILWARLQEAGASPVTAAMVRDAAAMAGLDFTEAEAQQIVGGVNQNLERYVALRKVHIDPHLPPPFHFSPIVPGTKLDRTPRPIKNAVPPSVHRPSNLEDAAFWPLTHLAQLIKTRQVTSVELTTMYLERCRRHNPLLNFIVTFTTDLAMQQAQVADREIRAGKYRGPLHGIPWGCKDIITVPGYPTQWGSSALRGQIFETEATVVRQLRQAGAVLVAKVSTGELASGDEWFGGRTNNPWNPREGSRGSSAGPASATGAGCIVFGIGTETGGSLLNPATMCGVTGMRPTFGRISRFGTMPLGWTLDRIGPICRTAEDCATVLSAIIGADENDLSAIDLPFNWDATLDVRKLRVGYLDPGAVLSQRDDDWNRNDAGVLQELKSLGIEIESFSLPEFSVPLLPLLSPGPLIGGFGAEPAASFDELMRTREKDLFKSGWRRGRLIPAVDYIQAQRARAVLMREFAAAMSKFDVYLAPFTDQRESAVTAQRTISSPIRLHVEASNLCGYPAVSVPNGFTKDGMPTSITFLGRLYNEAAVLALAKAYQDRAGWHKRTPALS